MKQETAVLALACLVIGFLLGHYLPSPHYEIHDNVILNTYTGEVTSTQEQWSKQHPNTPAAQEWFKQNGTNK